MAQEFLDRSNIITAFQQVSCEGIAEVWQVARFVNPTLATASLTAL